jgi:hypothetical protein
MELKLKEKGHDVINPFKLIDNAKKTEGRELTWDECMIIDIFFLKHYAEGVVFMKGWPNSRGCMDECDISIKYNKILLTEENINKL